MDGAGILTFGILGLCFILIVLGARWSAQRERARTASMKQMADRLGLRFSTSNPQLLHSLNQFNLFSRGNSRALKNVQSGVVDDVSVKICDFTYVTGSGKNRSTHHRAVVILNDDHLHLPSFVVMPQGMSGFWGSLFNGQDFDFDNDPTFSRRFILRGPSERALRALFKPVLRAAFLRLSNKRHMEGFESTVVLFVDEYASTSTFRLLLNEGLSLVRAMRQASA